MWRLLLEIRFCGGGGGGGGGWGDNGWDWRGE